MAGELAAIAQLGQVAWWQNDSAPLVGAALRFLEMEAAGYDEAVPLACLARALVADLGNQQATTLAELDRIPEGRSTHVDGPRRRDPRRGPQPPRPSPRGDAARRGGARGGRAHVPATGRGVRYGALWMTGAVDEALEGVPG